MFRGEHINVSEDRAVLHVALRMPQERSLIVDGEDVVKQVHEVLDRMGAFADRVRSGEWTGHTGKPIRNVVNIGIGGSDLGPVMAYEALRHYSKREMTFRFVSNVDGTDFAEATRDLDPEETLFIVSSKTFTTLETMTNAHTAREWALAGTRRRRGGDREALRRRLDQRRGGRRSSGSTPTTCSASGSGSAAATRWTRRSASRRCSRSGPRRFAEMLAGFHAIDEHFPETPIEANLPALMGLLAVWYGDFFGAQTSGVFPYDQYLHRFPAYLQQLTMESNGKHVTLDGAPGRLRHRRDLLGRAGHQRPALLLPADPPGNAADPLRLHRLPRSALNPLGDHHDLLISNVFAQAEALAFGKTPEQVRAEGTPEDDRAPPRDGGEPPLERDPRRAARPRARSARWSRSTSTASSPRARSGASTPSTSGGSSSARRSRRRSSPSSRPTEEPELDHDSSTNALIRRYRAAARWLTAPGASSSTSTAP